MASLGAVRSASSSCVRPGQGASSVAVAEERRVVAGAALEEIGLVSAVGPRLGGQGPRERTDRWVAVEDLAEGGDADGAVGDAVPPGEVQAHDLPVAEPEQRRARVAAQARAVMGEHALRAEWLHHLAGCVALHVVQVLEVELLGGDVVAGVEGGEADDRDELVVARLLVGQLEGRRQRVAVDLQQGDVRGQVVGEIDDALDPERLGCPGRTFEGLAEVDLGAVAHARRRRAQEEPGAVGGPAGDELGHVPVRRDDTLGPVRLDHPAGAAPGHRVVDEGDPAHGPHQRLGALDEGVGRRWEGVERHELDLVVLHEQRWPPDALHDRLQRERRHRRLQGVPVGHAIERAGAGQQAAEPRADQVGQAAVLRGLVDGRAQVGGGVQPSGHAGEAFLVGDGHQESFRGRGRGFF